MKKLRQVHSSIVNRVQLKVGLNSHPSPERATQSAPPLQGSIQATPVLPGLTPWAVLLDPCRVPQVFLARPRDSYCRIMTRTFNCTLVNQYHSFRTFTSSRTDSADL